MARVWRDGQKKPCFIYRMLATGSIEEKIFQRQTHKKALSNTVVDNDDSMRHFTKDDLRDLFSIDENCVSETHTMLVDSSCDPRRLWLFIPSNRFKCNRCVNNIQVKLPPESSDCTSDLSQWFHCAQNKGIPDVALSQAWDIAKCVSFVFHHRSSTTEVKLEDVVEKVGQKKPKKIYDEDDDFDEDFDEDDVNDEDYVYWIGYNP